MEKITHLGELEKIASIGKVLEIKPLNSGSGYIDKYILICTNGKFLQKIYRQDVPKNLSLLRYLKKIDFPCPELMIPENGIFSFQEKSSSIFSFLEGVKKEKLDGNDLTDVGNLIAKLHICGRGYAEKYYKKEMERGRDYGMLHGDINQSNMIFNRGHFSLIDFDSVRFGPFSKDLASLLFYVLLSNSPIFPSEGTEAFLESYSSLRPLRVSEGQIISREVEKRGKNFLKYSQEIYSRGEITEIQLQKRIDLTERIDLPKLNKICQKISGGCY
jgi:Ser/Thr protein kinase RdoA (MazF antagonist)